MASAPLHLLIAREVKGILEVKDEKAYYIGSIIPDAKICSNYTRKELHFEDVNYLSYTIEYLKKDRYGKELYKEFYFAYEEKIMEDDFIKGYFVHLVGDWVWKYMIYCVHADEISKNIQTLYKDYDILDYICIEKYNIPITLQPSDNITIPIISKEIVDEMLINYEAWMRNAKKHKKEDIKLEILELDKVEEFILESIKVIKEYVKEI